MEDKKQQIEEKQLFEFNDFCGTCQRYLTCYCPHQKEAWASIRWKTLNCNKYLAD